MTIQGIIKSHQQTGDITAAQVNSIVKFYRKETVLEIRNTPNRVFAYDLLVKFIIARKNKDHELGSVNHLMFACYLLGIHSQVEDSFLIWQAKNVDFDAYCGLDVQLVVFEGVPATLDYLKTIQSPEAKKAVSYLEECEQTGDFEDLDDYFSPDNLPWWI